jgi:TatD DNase family protein
MRVLPGSVDSHFHSLVMEQKDLPVAEILEYCFTHGLAYGLDIGIGLDDFAERKARTDAFPNVYLSAGLHPSQSGTVSFEQAESTLRSLLQEERVVALGEIGLDWYRNHATPQEQTELFVSQIELANELGLPVIVHNRDAARDIYEAFSAHPPAAESVMHCFAADATQATRFLDLGFTLSFGGNVTYKGSEDIREAARITPPDRIMAETDAPFLAPQAVRGRPNHPGYVGHTYDFLAELRGEAPKELAGYARENLERIFL